MRKKNRASGFRRGGGVSPKCERSYIRLISHPFSSNLLIKQVLQEVKRCVSKPHEDRWHPSASLERDKREPEWGIKQKRKTPIWDGQRERDNEPRSAAIKTCNDNNGAWTQHVANEERQKDEFRILWNVEPGVFMYSALRQTAERQVISALRA